MQNIRRRIAYARRFVLYMATTPTGVWLFLLDAAALHYTRCDDVATCDFNREPYDVSSVSLRFDLDLDTTQNLRDPLGLQSLWVNRNLGKNGGFETLWVILPLQGGQIGFSLAKFTGG